MSFIGGGKELNGPSISETSVLPVSHEQRVPLHFPGTGARFAASQIDNWWSGRGTLRSCGPQQSVIQLRRDPQHLLTYALGDTHVVATVENFAYERLRNPRETGDIRLFGHSVMII
jgi:hypothetical protein